MPSILSRFSRRFQTRNPARDAATDAARIITVRTAIEDAIASAVRERDGLEMRVNDHYTRAAFLLDEAPEYGERSESEEKDIADAERSAAAARRRIQAIDEQVGQLNAMLRVLDETAAERAA